MRTDRWQTLVAPTGNRPPSRTPDPPCIPCLPKNAIVVADSWATAEVPALPPGTYNVVISCTGLVSNPIVFTILGDAFSRGDCNQDSSFDISDAVSTLAALFILGTPQPLCDDACDTNDDG